MNDLFLNIVNISIRSYYIFLIVIVARIIMRKTPKIYSYVLWILFFIFALIPNVIPNVIPNIVNTSSNAEGNIANAPSIQNIGMEGTIAILDSENKNADHELVSNDNVIKLQNENNLLPLITLVWILVCASFIIYSMMSYIFLKLRLNNAVYMLDNIYESNAISTPFVFGIISPKIIIPATIMEEKREYIIAHERIHIKRLDYIVKAFVYLITVVHWFNPIMWISFKLLAQDMEMACDEKVLSQYNDSIKKSYSLTLVELAESRHNFASQIGFGESNVKRRVNHILKYHKANKKFSILAISILVISCLFFIMLPKNNIISIAQSGSYNDYDIDIQELTETEITTEDTYHQTRYPLLAELKEQNLFIYGIDTIQNRGVVLKSGNQIQTFDWTFLTPNFILPQLFTHDFDYDGKNEIICILTVASGTGVFIQELHILKLMEDGTYQDNVFEPRDYLKQINDAVAYEITNDIVTFNINGVKTSYPISTIMEDGILENIAYGNTVTFSYDNQIHISVAVEFYFKGVISPQYYPELIGEVEYNGGFRIENLRL